MSAHRFTDWRIQCNWAECVASVFASELPLPGTDLTAMAARKILKRRGWKINVNPVLVPRITTTERNLDFCPEHALLIN